MNRITMTNIRVCSDIKIDNKDISRIYFSGMDQKGKGQQIVSLVAMGTAAEAIKNTVKKGDYINLEGRLNTYNVKMYNITITYMEKSWEAKPLDFTKKQ